MSDAYPAWQTVPHRIPELRSRRMPWLPLERRVSSALDAGVLSDHAVMMAACRGGNEEE